MANDRRDDVKEGEGTEQERKLAAHALRAHAGAYGAKLADELERGLQRAPARDEDPPPPPSE